MNRLFAVAALSVCALAVGNAKTYDIHILNPTKAGAVELRPGDYKLKVEGSNVIFTDADSSQKFTTTAKMEEANQKFDQTRVETMKQGETDILQEIDLGGSRTKLEF